MHRLIHPDHVSSDREIRVAEELGTTGTIQRAVNRRIVRLNCTLQMNHRHGTNSHNRIDRRAVHQVLHHDQKGRDSAQSLEDRYEAQRKQRHFEARRREPDQLVDNVLLLRRSTRITLQSRPSRPRIPGGVVSHRLHNGPVHARTKLATGEMQTEERLGRRTPFRAQNAVDKQGERNHFMNHNLGGMKNHERSYDNHGEGDERRRPECHVRHGIADESVASDGSPILEMRNDPKRNSAIPRRSTVLHENVNDEQAQVAGGEERSHSRAERGLQEREHGKNPAHDEEEADSILQRSQGLDGIAEQQTSQVVL